ncbi:MAG: hypothetical protein ACRYF3_02120 [Janthinobacterium lividum]
MRERISNRIAFMVVATDGHHCRATKIIPFSMHHVDEQLADIGHDIGKVTKARQWLVPIDPGDYGPVTREIESRLVAATRVPLPQARPRPAEHASATAPE